MSRFVGWSPQQWLDFSRSQTCACGGELIRMIKAMLEFHEASFSSSDVVNSSMIDDEGRIRGPSYWIGAFLKRLRDRSFTDRRANLVLEGKAGSSGKSFLISALLGVVPGQYQKYFVFCPVASQEKCFSGMNPDLVRFVNANDWDTSTGTGTCWKAVLERRAGLAVDTKGGSVTLPADPPFTFLSWNCGTEAVGKKSCNFTQDDMEKIFHKTEGRVFCRVGFEKTLPPRMRSAEVSCPKCSAELWDHLIGLA